MDYNKVLLIGRLTRDPELRYLTSGTGVCEFGLATNHKYRSKEGESKEETCFVDIVAWGRQGETCKEYLKKGSGVFVEGRLTLDSWTSQDGQKRSRHRVVADRVQFLPRSAGRPDTTADPSAPAPESYQQFEARAGEPQGDPDVPF